MFLACSVGYGLTWWVLASGFVGFGVVGCYWLRGCYNMGFGGWLVSCWLSGFGFAYVVLCGEFGFPVRSICVVYRCRVI